MNKDTSFCHQPAAQHGIGGPDEVGKTTSSGMNDMTRMILAAIAAALLAGLLVLPVTMPGTARLWAEADLPALEAPTALIKGPASFRA